MKHSFQDHLGRAVEIEYPPRRIVSLCPSLTETLFTLDPVGEIVGRTEYCIHPADRVETAERIGGTKNIDLASVFKLLPDLVIAEQEENRKADVEALAAEVPVFVFDVRNYEQALGAIHDLGSIIGQQDQATQLVTEITARFARLRPRSRYTAAYLVWKDPYLAVGCDTYIHSLLEVCGMQNVCADLPGRYPTITPATLRGLSPNLLLLPSEPYPFDETHIADLVPQMPDTRIILVDGEMFSWYGSRMKPAADYLWRFLAQIEAISPES